MSKKQLILASMITAIPAWALVVFVLLNAFNHFGNWGVMHFVISVVAALCAIFLGVLPFLLAMFYREEPALALAGDAPSAPDAEAAPAGAKAAASDADDGFEDEIGDAAEDDDFEADDEGFDEFDDDFDDEL